MGMGRRRRQVQEEFWIATDSLPNVPQHAFYDKLNALLTEAGFDDFVEELCERYYTTNVGRSSIPPGVYFRMLFIGYFEGIDSQRGIAWRCADSRSLAKFLGYGPKESTPDHSSLTNTRNRLPLEVHEAVFYFVLQMAKEHRLLKGKTVAIDATTLEANAAMKSIVRKETGEDWKAYVVRLMKEERVIDEEDEPTDEEIRRYDKGRKNKKVSNDEWQSPADPDSRITKMKDSRTHLAYKAEHVIDLESDFLLAAEVYSGDAADTKTLVPSLSKAQQNLQEADICKTIDEVAADKGYHSAESLEEIFWWGNTSVRTYIAEPKRNTHWNWQERSWAEQKAVCGNHRRMKGNRGKRLQRQRSEKVERSFAHVCETGGARRTWLRGLEKIKKRYQMTAAGRNLGLMMRKLFGVGTPRSMQGLTLLLHSIQFATVGLRSVLRLSSRAQTITITWQHNHNPQAMAA